MFPPNSVLVAIDFSDASRSALSFAARLATQCAATLHVLHALDPLLYPKGRLQALPAEIRGELRVFSTSIEPAPRDAPAGAVPPTYVHHVVTGPPTDVICNIADRERADLIVLGARGLSGPRRPMFGSVTEGVLRCADVPVLVVPATWSPPRPDTPDLTGIGPVVVGLELSEPALGAAVAAATLAKALNTTLDLVHVVPTAPVLPRWEEDAALALGERVTSERRDLARAISGLGPDAARRLRVETGHVAETLAKAAESGADRHPLLVLGRRTRTDRCGAPGATAYRVLMLADVPVLVHLPDSGS